MPESRLYTLHALSAVHVGSGSGLSYIDLPLTREKTTDWPVVPGSGFKGVMSASLAAARLQQRRDNALLRAAFGIADHEGAKQANAGALVFTDALLVCLPVRSVHGTFAWTTCPLALSRLARDLTASGTTPPPLPTPTGISTALLPTGQPASALVAPALAAPTLVAPAPAQAASRPTATPGGAALSPGKNPPAPKQASPPNPPPSRPDPPPGSRIFLADGDFSATESPEAGQWADRLASLLFGVDQPARDAFRRRFAVLSDDAFTFFTTTGTEVSTRVHISAETGTVANGQLWTEESLPAESVLAGLVWCDRTYGKEVSPSQVLEHVCQARTVQIGGKATVGRGRVNVRFHAGGNGQ